MNPDAHAPTWAEALKRFLGEYLPRHRGASVRTQESYATALRLLTEGIDARGGSPSDLTVDQVFAFLDGLELRRRNGVRTRNLRLAALRSFWDAMKLFDPLHASHYERLLSIPSKRFARRSPDYLELDEMRCLLALPDARTQRGFRDLVMLRYFYNTGSRVSEVSEARTDWLSLTDRPEVTIRGKGGKWRVCPLWRTTAEMLRVYLRQERLSPAKGYEGFLFITRRGTAFDRKSLWKLVCQYFERAAQRMPGLQHKRLTTHSLRHTTAVHLLRAGVEINVIKAWLGHADVSTTSGYLDLDLDKKREALERFLKLDIDRMVGGADNMAPLPASIVSWLQRL
jgi:site-specific recombinase XerD